MKTKRLLSIIMAVSMLFCVLVVPATAANGGECHHHEKELEIIIHGDVSPEVAERIIDSIVNPEAYEDDGTAACGLTCDLFGHKTETTKVTAISHKERASDPRCDRVIFNKTVCTRCDYLTTQLISRDPISCC